ncbi:MAG TPA: hypothetical protein VEK73_11015 [Xanthobacteraceae bacterium]|nr:hypothetical protein [Xanthobacteraceae bacterium]
MSYVNLKDLAEFNKYTTGLGAGAFIYFDKFETGHHHSRTVGIILAAIVVFLGVIVMSVKGRIEGDTINYKTETDAQKMLLFKIVSRTLSAQLVVLVLTIGYAGYLSLARIWNWP